MNATETAKTSPNQIARTSLQVQPYLFFDGRCDEALEYYRRALGAEVTALMRFKEGPDSSMCAPNSGDKVMHASFRVGETLIMASDGNCGGKPKFEGFSLAIAAPSDADAKRFFDNLADGGQVQQPLTNTFFASSFGMVVDRFGVGWMVMAGPTKS
jgi:PhnB protein